MTKLICICCPKGCHLVVDEENKTCEGNSCPRGKVYGLNEVINPTRVLTSTVSIKGAIANRLPVKTDRPIPKGMIMDVMKVISKISCNSPVMVGDILVENVLDTGANIVACRNM